jgi:peroxiredoxin family protein
MPELSGAFPGAYPTSAADAAAGAMLARLEQLEARMAALEGRVPDEAVTIVVSSNDFDKLMPAFIISTGAVSMGMKASLFFTFWGLTALRKKPLYKGKTMAEKMLTMMTPGNANKTGLSKMNMWGMGIWMMKQMMERHNVTTLPELMGYAKDLGVEMIACQMTMGLMGVTQEELIDGLEYAGVARYLDLSSRSKITLFI